MTADNTFTYDVIVIGGGLLGCFTARSLAACKLKIALLEQHGDLCTGVSRANTAVVYSGCDTKPGTLKASMCVRAARGFGDLCDELGVRYSRCGSVMVSFGRRGTGVLQKKLEQGRKNGVPGIRLLSREEVLELEPNLAKNVVSGLYAPDTGTVMPWELCLAAAENASQNGVDIFLDTGVKKIVRDGGGWRIYAGSRVFYARGLAGCAGLDADKLYEAGTGPVVKIVPTAGDYFILDTKAAGHIRHVIFHEPEEKGKGLTLVPTLDGNILVGPTDRPIDCGPPEYMPDGDRPPQIRGFETAHEGMDLLRALVSEVMPSLPIEHVIRSFGALRPNPYLLKRDESGAMVLDSGSIGDFCIIESDDGSFINFAGIKTPGMTCADELGRYAAEKLANRLGAEKNPDFDPRRPPPVRLRELSFEKRQKLVRARPDYGKIVCRCKDISEGEVIDAIRRFPGAKTKDGVKRRAGAGLGRCQGGFCGQTITELLETTK